MQFQEDELSDEGEWSELRATYDRLRTFYNAVGFADMIVSARTAIEERSDLIEHDFWIVDEFQDFNRAEEHLIRALTDTATGVLIAGDDEQALYQQMKGATPEIIVAYYEDRDFANAMLPYAAAAVTTSAWRRQRLSITTEATRRLRSPISRWRQTQSRPRYRSSLQQRLVLRSRMSSVSSAITPRSCGPTRMKWRQEPRRIRSS